MEWLNGVGGLYAWAAIMLAIVGVGLFMRHLSVSGRSMRLRQVALIVAASIGLLVIAGVGGLALMNSAATGG